MLTVYSDGSAHGHPNLPGGWAFVVLRDEVELDSGSGGSKKTTNNHMELRAAIAGLESAERLRVGDEPIVLMTDSRLTIDVAEGRDEPVRLDAETEELRTLVSRLVPTFQWVRAHAGHFWNEHVDGLARAARQRFVKAKRR
jgi:ribonuclease HI